MNFNAVMVDVSISDECVIHTTNAVTGQMKLTVVCSKNQSKYLKIQ